MADITAGDAYVDATLGTDDATHGTGAGTNACKTLSYIFASRITTLTGALVVHCAGGADTYTGALTISGHSTAANKLTIKGDRWDTTTNGLFSTSAYYLKHNFDNHFLTLTELNLEFDGMQFSYDNAGNNNIMVRTADAGGATVLTFKNCILRATAGSGTVGLQVSASNATTTFTVQNCVLYALGTALSLPSSDAVCNIYNCTLHGNALGISASNKDPTVQNCVFDNNTADFTTAETWTAGSDYNSTTSATALPGTTTHDYTECTDFNFSDLTNHDFRLTATSGDPNIRDSGTTIAACSPDPIGTTRPSETAYSRGAFEYVSAGGGGITLPLLRAIEKT